MVIRRLGVRYVDTEQDPYASAAELCGELRRHGSMTLRTSACEPPHPVLDSGEGGVLDRLRVVHDVFGHRRARARIRPAGRPGTAFRALVGAVTAYVPTGEKPGLRADLPPADLLGACDLVA